MAAQRGRGTGAYTAAVPLADGGTDNYPEEVRQDSQTARIYGMTLCKTEKFPGSPAAVQGCRIPAAHARFPEDLAAGSRILLIFWSQQKRRHAKAISAPGSTSIMTKAGESMIRRIQGFLV